MLTQVRAMLHSVDPTASDYEILLIYQRCSIAERSEVPDFLVLLAQKYQY